MDHLLTLKYAMQAVPQLHVDEPAPSASKGAFGGSAFAFGSSSPAGPAFGGFTSVPFPGPHADKPAPSTIKAHFGDSSSFLKPGSTAVPTFGASSLAFSPSSTAGPTTEGFTSGAPSSAPGVSQPAHNPSLNSTAGKPVTKPIAPSKFQFGFPPTSAAEDFSASVGSAADNPFSATAAPAGILAQPAVFSFGAASFKQGTSDDLTSLAQPAVFSFGAAPVKQDTSQDMAASVRQALKLAREAKQETGTLRSEVHTLRSEVHTLRKENTRLREDVGLADWQAIKQFVADCGHDK